MNKINKRHSTLATILLVFGFASMTHAATIYVRPGGGGAQNGTSWANAYAELQTALTNAPGGSEIWVAAGTYRPDLGANDPTMSFTLKNDVAIYGGFNGSETAREQRNVAANVTILSGDIGTPGVNTDNTHHVVFAQSVSNTGILDGFTIQDGYGLAAPENFQSGGGVSFRSAGATLRNLVIRNCTGLDGGGMSARFGPPSPIVLENVTFQNNAALSNRFGGGFATDQAGMITFVQCQFLGNSSSSGGAVSIAFGSDATFTDCLFDGNHSTDDGGALTIANNPAGQLTRVTFRNNTCADRGAAIYFISSQCALDACVFERNHASGSGGAIYSTASTTILRNSRFHGNTAASQGGAIFGGGSAFIAVQGCAVVGNVANSNFGAMAQNTGFLIITNSTVTQNHTPGLVGGAVVAGGATGIYKNSIFWNNSDSTGNSLSSAQFSWISGNPEPTVEYCNFNGSSGPTWYDVDPQFFRNPTPGGDGNWGTADDDYGDLRIGCGSVLADAGDNDAVPVELTTDLGGLPRFTDNPQVADAGNGTAPIVDIGAHEFQPGAGCGACLLTAGGCTLATPAVCGTLGGVFVGSALACSEPAFVVNRLATPGGDGSAGAPFMTFGEAVGAASPGATTKLVITAAGHYAESVNFNKPMQFINLTGGQTIRIGH